MKYELSNRYSFCGFKNLPFAVLDKARRNYIFFNREEFELIYRCAAHTDIDKEKLNDSEKDFLEFVLSEEMIREIGDDVEGIVPEYHSYPNHVRKDVQWSITGACNYKCKHCFMSAPHAVFGEPTFEECLEIIKQMKECGILTVGITGGEPLIRKDFWDIMDALNEADIAVNTVYSNGWLVNEALLDEFEKRHMHPAWQISFDGIGTHDELRGVKGAEERAINAIKLLISRGYSVGAAYSIYRGNRDVFIDSLKLLGELGVRYVKTGYTSPQGEFAEHPELQLTSEEELEFYKEKIPAYLKAGRPIDLQCEGLFFGYSDKSIEERKELEKQEGFEYADECANCAFCESEATEVEDEEEAVPEYRFLRKKRSDEAIAAKCDVCGVLRQHFYISAGGHVLPCMSLDGTPMGDAFPNMFESSLQQILTDSWYITATDFRVKDYWDNLEECRDCEHRMVCLAGCRAMAAVYGSPDYLALDQRTCMIVKEGWADQIQECISEAGL